MKLLAVLMVCVLATTAWAQPRNPATFRDEIDELTEIQQRGFFQPNSFIFTFDTPPAQGRGGTLTAEALATNPALATLPANGISQARVELRGCGVIFPHFHPRGTEFAYVLNGQLNFQFLEENQAKYFGGVIDKGQTVILPAGTVHFAVNPTCEPASFLASFDNRDAGAVFLHQQLFSALTPDKIIRAATGVRDVGKVRTFITANGANPGLDDECAAKCPHRYRRSVGQEGIETFEEMVEGVRPEYARGADMNRKYEESFEASNWG